MRINLKNFLGLNNVFSTRQTTSHLKKLREFFYLKSIYMPMALASKQLGLSKFKEKLLSLLLHMKSNAWLKNWSPLSEVLGSYFP
jgi:hypothetical protein